eukprot:6172013-Pleurochrysis_carterae.AAC.2
MPFHQMLLQILLVGILPCCECWTVPGTGSAPVHPSLGGFKCGLVVSMSTSRDDDELQPPEYTNSDAMLESFKTRLAEEGGEANFRMRTDAERVPRNALQSAQQLSKGVRDVLDLDGERAKPGEGLLDVKSWRLTVFFFGLVVVLSTALALRGTPQAGEDVGNFGQSQIDTFTSDGQPLMFGKR